MSRSLPSARRGVPLGNFAVTPRLLLAVALTLVVAVAAGLLLAQILMSPPASDMRLLALYLAAAAGISLVTGGAILRLTDQIAVLSLRTKAVLGVAVGSGVALLNVLIVAQLMFIDTAHDLRLLMALILSGAVVSAFFGVRVAAATTGRLSTVAGGISTLAAGAYDIDLQIGGRDEVARLAADVQVLAARLRQSEADRAAMERERRDLIAAISHDLRTPLASVRAMVDALDDGVIEEQEEVARYYRTMRHEIERLSRLIDDLFELAQLDAGALKLHRTPLPLPEIAAEVVDAMGARARQAGVTLTLDVQGAPPDLSLDGARIERALANLVANALEHTPSGGSISVRVVEERDAVCLEVRDSGEGIDPADLPRIWDRFYRAERSRRRGPRNDDGAGLGLAIVRGITEAHGGSVTVHSTPGHGATFTLRFPLTAST